MKNLVSTAKMLLIERAVEIYNDRRSDLNTFQYADHYKELGKIIARIDEYNFLSDIIRDIEQDEYGRISLFGSDEDLASFMKDLYDSI